MKCMKIFTALLFFVSLMSQSGMAQGEEYTELVERPANHVWDRDNLFRNSPEILLDLSKTMKDLQKEYGMDLYLVIYSSLIGEKPGPFLQRCHDAWLGKNSDGLVVVLSFNEGMAGEIGRSNELYDGHFIEQGLLPRISYLKIQQIVMNSIAEVQKENVEVEKVRVFIDFLTQKLKGNLESKAEADASRESYHFMGWMALALILCGVVMAFLSRLMGAVDRKSKKFYHFPDFTVPQRLRAPNGGGKIGVVDF